VDADRFDAVLRALALGSSRRRVLAGLSGGLLAHLSLGAMPQPAQARKKKKSKASGACASSCSATCSTCYARVAGGTLCGGVGVADCALSCTSDTDCNGKIHPFCTTSFTSRATGKSSSWGCPAACTSIGNCST
jgi:hypothetical protein